MTKLIEHFNNLASELGPLTPKYEKVRGEAFSARRGTSSAQMPTRIVQGRATQSG